MRVILLHLLTAALYGGLWLACSRPHLTSKGVFRPANFILLVALIGHGLVLGGDLFERTDFRFGLINALSLTMWLAMVFYALESLLKPLDGLLVFASPVAAISALLPVVLGGHPITVPLSGWPIRLHIVVAMTAYSLFTLAAFHAILMIAVEKSLHRGAPSVTLGRMPPLLTLEHLLFKLISAAFVFLTITVLSGFLFSEQIFGTPFVLTHKSIFSVLAWSVFGALLVGRKLKGWRGKVALRWTISGMVLMLFAYAGSRFVLEFVLGRSN